MAGSVYLETTIFSFFYDERPSSEIVSRRNWTRRWWNERRHTFDLVTSTAVLDELTRGRLAHRGKAVEMARAIPAMVVTPEVSEIVAVYVAHRLMPTNPVGDALHLALASFHKCEFLMTWNC